ncbi:M50 family metallopeptidase [Nocardia sp. CDC159]|uniref:M50 family metallopeptidase n=1 Tax=Nocardia pulmonis TaxID=2951408 RepID=A0A9X2IYP5_9NOCA|nr:MULTISPECIES: M50 family metallopeptidase [Nocardia]MCM6775225.1 M50 family metallopeptidase [Nocardia pulmonis]MCM6788041.1 M50 family metallopeptidase [Nocardia sp. CDC159]
MTVAESVSSVAERLTLVSPHPPLWVVLATAGAALLAVVYPPLWRILRTAVTIAHELGHAVVAVLTGRTLRSIRLHSDTSGVTVSRGKPYGLGMILTTMAGYPAPSALGLGCAALLAEGRLTLMLWLVVAALAVLLVMIRNLFGLLAVLCAGAVVFAVSWYGTVVQQGVFGYAVAWFLLFGGMRTIAELQRVHMRGDGSDADQLAYLTRIPGLFWVLLFGAGALAALIFGGRLLLGYWPSMGSA